MLALALGFAAFCLYAVIANRQETFEQFITDHGCIPTSVKVDSMGRKYREYHCEDGIGEIGPFYDLPQVLTDNRSQ